MHTTDRIRTPSTFMICLIVVTVGCMVFIAVFQQRAHSQAMAHLQDHARIVASSLWNFEPSSPKTYLTLATQTLGYERVVVQDAGGTTFIEIDGPALTRLERLLSGLRLIPHHTLKTPIVFEDRPIGTIAAVWPCKTIYTYGYLLVCALLLLTGVGLFLRLISAKKNLESRVQTRTAALEKEINERKQAEQFLKESQADLKVAMDQARLVHWEADVTKDIFYFNDTFYAMYGTSAEREGGYQMDGLEYAKRFLYPEDIEQFAGEMAKTLDSDGPNFSSQIEHRIIRRDGQERFIAVRYRVARDESGQVVRTFVVNQDITERIQAESERKILEARLRQVQKLESVGTLAGGIAHDFNNLLSIILGHAELLQLGISDPNHLKHSTDQIISASERARQLVHQILAFSRHTKQPKQLVHLPSVIGETLAFLRASLPSTIEIQGCTELNDACILGDPTQIQQALINLCTNGAHAMGKQGGRLLISLDQTTLTQEETCLFMDAAPGEYLRLSVADTGCGIDPSIMERIYDPYFTTKEFGKGAGLGLSVVHGIVASHGGGIRVSSQVGQGSTFTLLLPRASADLIDQPDNIFSNSPTLVSTLLS